MYPNGYTNRLLVTQDNTKVSGTADISDFRMVFTYTDNLLRSVANGGKVQNASAWDIRFELLNGTKLDHEIVSWNSTTGFVEAWIRIPTLTYATATKFWVYFGKSGLVATEENLSGLWANYRGAFHGGSSAGTWKNSADATKNASKQSNIKDSRVVTTNSSGKLGECINFPGTSTVVSSMTGTTAIPFGMTTDYVMVAQSFVADASGHLGMVRIRKRPSIGTFTNGGNWLFTIQADSGGSPSGTDIAGYSAATQDWWNVIVQDTDIYIDFPGNINLTPGTTYWLVLKTTGGITNDTNYFNVAYDPTASYGVLKKYNGSAWGIVTGSLRFEVLTADYLQIGTAMTFPYQSFTWEFWMKRSSTSYQTILQEFIRGSEGRFDTGKTSTSHFEFESDSNNIRQWNGSVSPTNPADGSWHHIVLVSNPSNMLLYADGVLRVTTTINTDNVDQRLSVFGGWGQRPVAAYGLPYDGQLDEIMLNALILDADHIKTRYNNQNSPATFYTVTSVAVNKSFQADSSVLAIQNKTLSATIWAFATQFKTIDVNGYVKDIILKSFITDAYILKTSNKTLSSDALVLKTSQQTLDIKALIEGKGVLFLSMDAYLLNQYQLLLSTETYVFSQQLKAMQTDGFIDAPRRVIMTG